MERTEFAVVPMTRSYAEVISTWRYPAPYSLYDFSTDSKLLEELLGGSYHAVCRKTSLVGYYCFGEAARIPLEDPAPYGGYFLDIGLGLRPELCGQGWGLPFLLRGMEYTARHNSAEQLGSPGIRAALRLTVAAFNCRAITVYERAGFVKAHCVNHKCSGERFWIMKIQPSA